MPLFFFDFSSAGRNRTTLLSEIPLYFPFSILGFAEYGKPFIIRDFLFFTCQEAIFSTFFLSAAAAFFVYLPSPPQSLDNLSGYGLCIGSS